MFVERGVQRETWPGQESGLTRLFQKPFTVQAFKSPIIFHFLYVPASFKKKHIDQIKEISRLVFIIFIEESAELCMGTEV